MSKGGAKLPGLPDVGDLDILSFNHARVILLLSLVTLVGTDQVDRYLKTGKFDLPGLPDWIAEPLIRLVSDAEQTIGGPLFDALIGGAVGVPGLGAAGSQEEQAVAMIKRFLGFGTALPVVVGQLEVPLKAILGDHLGSTMFEGLKDLPQDLGINFFLGTVIERIFETSVSRPLEEALAERFRPNRLEWPQLRALVRAKALDEATFRDRAAKQGFRESDLDLLVKLDRVFLSVGDLEQLWAEGIWPTAERDAYYATLGFNEPDAAALGKLAAIRASGAGAAQLRGVAQKGYLEGHLSRDQYVGFLAQASIPELSIDFELEAADLLLSFGKTQLSVAEVKRLRQAGHLDDHVAITDLTRLGYTEADATALVEVWKDDAKTGRVGLSESRILAYLKGGVLDKAQAYEFLVGAGYRTSDARFLVDHPDSSTSVLKHQLSQTTVLAALKDGIIDQDRAALLLKQLGIEDQEVQLSIQVALHSSNRRAKPKAAGKSLSEAQVIEAFKYHLAESTWAVRELVALGYSDADAQLVVAIEETKEAKAIPDGWAVLS